MAPGPDGNPYFLYTIVLLLVGALAPFFPDLHQYAILQYYRFNTHQTNFSDLNVVSKIRYNDIILPNPAVDSKVLHDMNAFGFFYVIDIPEYDATKELELLKHVFELPSDVKHTFAVRKHNPNNKNVYRGYGPAVDNVGTQYKEVFNIGPHETEPAFDESSDFSHARHISKEKNVWPSTDNKSFDEEFRDTFSKGFRIRVSIAKAVINCIGRLFNSPSLINRFTHHEFSTLGLRKYPKRSRNGTKLTRSELDNEVLTELEHVDSTVTVLSTFFNPGLQALYDGSYRDVPPSGGGFLINIGTLLEDITDNRIISVRHRVKDIQRDRYAIPFFFNPSFDADISTSVNGNPTPAGKETPTFGHWMTKYLPAVEPILLEDDSLGR
uniref:Putative isopenicillin-n-synthase n=1 Tax=Charistephane fugiens TaxID=140462 RepID=A0A0A0RW30_9METZ|nr:putative isopenicillin-n-synthase [Charistephane fugiens]